MKVTGRMTFVQVKDMRDIPIIMSMWVSLINLSHEERGFISGAMGRSMMVNGIGDSSMAMGYGKGYMEIAI